MAWPALCPNQRGPPTNKIPTNYGGSAVTAVAYQSDTAPGIRIDEIRVGERARKDYGDIEPLKASIVEHGLLQPIVLLPDNYLLCGGRRLAACKELGWDSIPFVRSRSQEDAISRLKAERDENTCRKDMTPSELVAIGKKLEEMKRPAAAERQGTRTDLTSGPSGPEVDSHAVRAEVAEAIGMTEALYKRAKRVVETANDESAPSEVREVAQVAQAEMDAGKLTISAADNKVAAAKLAAEPSRKLPEIERLAQIRELAPTGMTSGQIGERIGVNEEQVRKIANRHSVEIPADKVMRGTRRLDHTKFVVETVSALEALASGLDVLDLTKVDHTQVEHWATSLTDSLKKLSRLRNDIKEMTQ